MLPAKLIIFGAPRTKKNHSRVVRAGRRLRLLPSAAHERWARSAIPQLRSQWHAPPLVTPVAVKATFYRERNVGDLVNYLQALADALEAAGVVANDRLIASWDGSRLLKDAASPRIEVEITTERGEP
jgi:Holliday junction resolvase RusA-like endonuclease